jgi:hypothetical protein
MREIVNESLTRLLRFQRAHEKITAEFARVFHNADILPLLQRQLETVLNACGKFEPIVYDCQGINDDGSDIVIRFDPKSNNAESHAAPSHAFVGDRGQQATSGKLAHGVVERAEIYMQLLPCGRDKTGCATSRCGRLGAKLGESVITSRFGVFHASTSQKGAFRYEVCGEETKGRAD